METLNIQLTNINFEILNYILENSTIQKIYIKNNIINIDTQTPHPDSFLHYFYYNCPFYNFD